MAMGLYWLALLDRKEFAAHREIAETLGIDVFFAHRVSSVGVRRKREHERDHQAIHPQEIIIRKPQRQRYSIDTEQIKQQTEKKVEISDSD